MPIIIDQVRIDGFRGLKDFQMSLSSTTVLTGMNNVGKTSVLKALQLVFGNSSFLSSEDFHIENNNRTDKIIIDIRIIPTNDDGDRLKDFEDDWIMAFKADNIKYDTIEEQAHLPFRTVIEYDPTKGYFTRESLILSIWNKDGVDWKNLTTTKKFVIPYEQLPFFYIDAHRDILEDIKLKSSYIGKMLNDVSRNYSESQVQEIEKLINDLNKKAIDNSEILSSIQDSLSGLNSAMDSVSSTVSITPFTKKIRDLNKSLSIQYGSETDTFTMDYHGMGTRSWSSLLTFKAFLNLHLKSLTAGNVCCPIIAIEEPESHLHPNAQKQLYSQMNEIGGLKIISTHSPYVATCSKLTELRVLYKKNNNVYAGFFNNTGLHSDEIRQVERQVICSHGELLFSKAIVLFEGETESIALPLYAEKEFNAPAFKFGVDFVGVGGFGFYAPYVRFASSFGIPWFIFSDGEQDAIEGVEKSIKKALNDNSIKAESLDNVFFIPNGGDYETYLTSLDYLDVFKDAHKKNIEQTESNYRAIEGKKKKVDTYTLDDYKDKAHKNKTEWAGIMANAIIDSDKSLPPLITELLNKIKKTLQNE